MKVVFYTAYNQYMIHAIRESAFDYLLKPFHHKELEEILARFMTYKVHAFTQELPVGVGTPLVAVQPFIIFTPTNDMRALRPSEIGFSDIVVIVSSGKCNFITSYLFLCVGGLQQIRLFNILVASCRFISLILLI